MADRHSGRRGIRLGGDSLGQRHDLGPAVNGRRASCAQTHGEEGDPAGRGASAHGTDAVSGGDRDGNDQGGVKEDGVDEGHAEEGGEESGEVCHIGRFAGRR